MAEKIKKGDFVELTYTGRIAATKEIFDLNDEKVAEKVRLHQKGEKYEPAVICVGRRNVIEGLDDALEGKQEGDGFEVTIPAEKAFGKRDPKLCQLVNASKFKGDNMRPYPGMQITVNNMPALVRSVSGGRIMVDFNHPLAGKDVLYQVTVGKLVTEPKRQVENLLKMLLQLKDVKVDVEGDLAKVDLEIPEMLAPQLEKSILECVKGLKKVEFKKPSSQNK